MSASKVTSVSGRAIVVRGNDIDTDRIIPARFLKAITFEGLGSHVFEDDRLEAKGRGGTHPFDVPAFQGAQVLFVDANFGCGSSREHAPQALSRWGIRAVVGHSFAEIFFGNSLMIGLPCLTASPDDLARLMALVEADPTTVFTVDVVNERVSSGSLSVPAMIPASVKQSLVTGEWDATGLLLENYEEVTATAARLPYIAGFPTSASFRR